jgi:hypothetical protein
MSGSLHSVGRPGALPSAEPFVALASGQSELVEPGAHSYVVLEAALSSAAGAVSVVGSGGAPVSPVGVPNDRTTTLSPPGAGATGTSEVATQRVTWPLGTPAGAQVHLEFAADVDSFGLSDEEQAPVVAIAPARRIKTIEFDAFREAAGLLMRMGRASNVPTFASGHRRVTKHESSEKAEDRSDPA